jgi:hypothetical protein
MKQFSPSYVSKLYKFRCRLRKYKEGWQSYNLYERRTRNIPIMFRIFSKLHYLGSHSYVQNKWYRIERNFIKRHRRLDL